MPCFQFNEIADFKFEIIKQFDVTGKKNVVYFATCLLSKTWQNHFRKYSFEQTEGTSVSNEETIIHR